MSTEKILEEINELILEENGSMVSENCTILDTELDSFGVVVLFAELDMKFDCFPKEWLSEKVVENITIAELISRIQDAGPK